MIRKRFDPETIDFLVNLKWWNWSIEQITENLPAITEGNIELLKKS